jgi:hypothetical protein
MLRASRRPVLQPERYTRRGTDEPGLGSTRSWTTKLRTITSRGYWHNDRLDEEKRSSSRRPCATGTRSSTRSLEELSRRVHGCGSCLGLQVRGDAEPENPDPAAQGAGSRCLKEHRGPGSPSRWNHQPRRSFGVPTCPRSRMWPGPLGRPGRVRRLPSIRRTSHAHRSCRSCRRTGQRKGRAAPRVRGLPRRHERQASSQSPSCRFVREGERDAAARASGDEASDREPAGVRRTVSQQPGASEEVPSRALVGFANAGKDRGRKPSETAGETRYPGQRDLSPPRKPGGPAEHGFLVIGRATVDARTRWEICRHAADHPLFPNERNP